MKYLLDTHILLWAAAEPHKLHTGAKSIIENLENELFFSVASLWEVVIKNSLGRSDFHIEPGILRRALLDNGYIELPVQSTHVVALGSLPPIHKDPFDRILIAQAMSEGILLLTSDDLIKQYSGPIQFFS